MDLRQFEKPKNIAIIGAGITAIGLLFGMVHPMPGVWTPLAASGNAPRNVARSSRGEFSAGDFSYRNTKVLAFRPSGDRGFIAGRLVAVTATVTNNGSESSAPRVSMELRDSQGRIYKKAALGYQADIPNGKQPTDYILPGQTREVWLGVFDVANDAQGLKPVVSTGFDRFLVEPL